MLKQQKIFFDFLRFCIGSAKEIPDSLKEADWKELYCIAQKQALLGVLFYGIQRLPKELAPEQKLLMQWMVMGEWRQTSSLSQNEFAQLSLCEALSYWGFERTIVQNLACCMEEDTWNKITDSRANGSLSPFFWTTFRWWSLVACFYTNRFKLIKWK